MMFRCGRTRDRRQSGHGQRDDRHRIAASVTASANMESFTPDGVVGKVIDDAIPRSFSSHR